MDLLTIQDWTWTVFGSGTGQWPLRSEQQEYLL